MSNHHFYQPQIIFTRLKDVFNENKYNENIEDFSPENFVQSRTIKKEIELKEKKKKKEQENLTEEKKKYINKELVESWIEAIKMSKLFYY